MSILLGSFLAQPKASKQPKIRAPYTAAESNDPTVIDLVD